MIKTKFFAAAAVMTSLIATPVLAKDMTDNAPGKTQAQIKKQTIKKSTMRMSDRRMNSDARFDRGYDDTYRGYDNRYSRTGSGFFPADLAAGIVGGAVNTAGAIATAPFGGPDYAYNDGYRTNIGWGWNRTAYDDSYAPRSAYRGSYASIDRYPRVGAFATAPNVNQNPYRGATGWYGQSYAERNGFVCDPGSVYTNANGIRTLCQ